MISHVIPIEIDEKGGGRAPLPKDVEAYAANELSIDSHAGVNATVSIKNKEIVIENARPYGYFNVSFYVLEEHDIYEPPDDETRDIVIETPDVTEMEPVEAPGQLPPGWGV